MTAPGRVVPDCDRPDRCHTPPGPVPAAYVYTYFAEHCLPPCLPEHNMTLCATCCALTLMTAHNHVPRTWMPPPLHIRVVRDANTGEPVIPAGSVPGGPVVPRFAVVMDPALFLPHTRVTVLLDYPV